MFGSAREIDWLTECSSTGHEAASKDSPGHRGLELGCGWPRTAWTCRLTPQVLALTFIFVWHIRRAQTFRGPLDPESFDPLMRDSARSGYRIWIQAGSTKTTRFLAGSAFRSGCGASLQTFSGQGPLNMILKPLQSRSV